MSLATEPHVEKPPSAAPSAPIPAPPGDLPVTRIERQVGWQLVDLAELWRFRELLYFLTWRDVKIRYKQTALGIAWSVLQPLATMIVFTLFLGRVVGTERRAEHYSLFVLAGILPWLFFANAIMAAGSSVVGNERLVTRIYFPRLVIPLSAVGASLIDFAVASVLLAGVMLWFGVAPSSGLLLVPAIVGMLLLLATGVGTLLAALTVAYRDVRYLMTFGIQLWMFATPTIYLPASAIGPRGRDFLPLNPAFGLIHAFREAVLDGGADGVSRVLGLDAYSWYALSVSSGTSLILLVVGCLYFRRVERGFADII